MWFDEVVGMDVLADELMDLGHSESERDLAGRNC